VWTIKHEHTVCRESFFLSTGEILNYKYKYTIHVDNSASTGRFWFVCFRHIRVDPAHVNAYLTDMAHEITKIKKGTPTISRDDPRVLVTKEMLENIVRTTRVCLTGTVATVRIFIITIFLFVIPLPHITNAHASFKH